MTARPDQADQAARAMRDDIVRVTGGRVVQWVTIHDIAHRLGLDDDVAEAAVRQAVEHGWVVTDGEPPHSVRLSTTQTHPG
jgi:ribosomal protein S25